MAMLAWPQALKQRMEIGRSNQHEETWILVQKVKAGEREAFQAIIRLYQRKVFGLAYSIFHNREDALDIVQETFLRLHQKIDSYQEGKNFQGWMMQIAKNLCVDYYRKHYHRKKELETGTPLDTLNVQADSPGGNGESRELKEILIRCVDQLAERQRLIFVMRHFNHLKNDEIAQVLNISLGTVKSLHFKAVQNLRSLMSPYMGRPL
jgi:RNA polymerase sigma-70 factor (ECF subfamily)